MYHFCIILTRSTSTETANYPGTKLVGVAIKLRKRMKNSPSRSPQNLEFGHLTLLFCRGRQRTVPKFKTHVQSDCFVAFRFSLLSLLLKFPGGTVRITQGDPPTDSSLIYIPPFLEIGKFDPASSIIVIDTRQLNIFLSTSFIGDGSFWPGSCQK